MLTSTGVVMTVATGAAAETMRRAAARRHDFDAHDFCVVDARSSRPQSKPLSARRERMRRRCRRYSVGSVALEALDAAVAGAPPGAAVAMMQLIDLCIADTGFILVIVDDGERAGLGPSFVQTVQAAFDRELVADASPDLGPSLRLIRPNPRRL